MQKKINSNKSNVTEKIVDIICVDCDGEGKNGFGEESPTTCMTCKGSGKVEAIVQRGK